MPTVKPRIAITLEQETFDVIARLAELQSRSKGAVVADLIESVLPPLRRTIALIEAAQQAPEHVKAGLRSVVEATHDDLLKIAGSGNQQLDMLLQELSSAGSQAGSTPVPVTRGSGSPQETPTRRLINRKNRSGKGD